MFTCPLSYSNILTDSRQVVTISGNTFLYQLQRIITPKTAQTAQTAQTARTSQREPDVVDIPTAEPHVWLPEDIREVDHRVRTVISCDERHMRRPTESYRSPEHAPNPLRVAYVQQ